MRVLHVVPEVYPVVKTGGLADVAAALPAALAQRGHDVRLLIPGYPAVLEAGIDLEPVMTDANLFWGGPAQLLFGRLQGVGVPVYVLDSAGLFNRAGNPYIGPDGDWPDNHLRFAALGWAAAWLTYHLEDWHPQVVHAHDWQAGLAPAHIHCNANGQAPPATVMTIHNIAYQGCFPASCFSDLALPEQVYGVHGVEFWGGVGFLKAGLVYADKITTVSRTYAHEIQGPRAGNGFDGLLRDRHHDVVGIVNGVDYDVWNPAADPHLPAPYWRENLAGKAAAKAELQRQLGLDPDPDALLFGSVNRIAWLKGIDLLIGAIPNLVHRGAQLALLGNGDPWYEGTLAELERQYKGRVVCHVAFNEALSHLIQGAADAVLVPSRSEPCGLTQLYALRYGTVPVVRHVGGLADTVVNAEPWNLAAGIATGFVFWDPSIEALSGTIDWACDTYRDRATWESMQQVGMAQDFSWGHAAAEYEKVYQSLLH